MDSLKHRLSAALQTDRLVLTTPTMAHAPAIAHLAKNQRIHAVMARLPFPHADTDALAGQRLAQMRLEFGR